MRIGRLSGRLLLAPPGPTLAPDWDRAIDPGQPVGLARRAWLKPERLGADLRAPETNQFEATKKTCCARKYRRRLEQPAEGCKKNSVVWARIQAAGFRSYQVFIYTRGCPRLRLQLLSGSSGGRRATK